MKFSCHLPIGHIGPEFQSDAAIVDMIDLYERVGVDACNITDHPAPDANWLHAAGHDALDPFAALAYVAARSRTLYLHTAIVVLPYRSPFVTAKAAATVQLLSGGRLILGVGAGYQKNEFDALGVDFHRRGALMDDALDTIRRAWAGGPVVKHGTGYTAIGNEPRPVPDPAPPIWIGGGSDKAIERAARAGDGWNPFFAVPTMSRINQETGVKSLQDLRDKIARINDMRASHGRTGPYDFAADPLISFESMTAADAQRHVDHLSQLAGAGLTWASFDPYPAGAHRSFTRAAYLDAVQWFGEEVIAHMRHSG